MIYTIDDLLDHRNRALYQEVAGQVPVSLRDSEDEYWGAILKDGVAHISCAPSAKPVSGFTHELLHIKRDLAGMKRPGYQIEAASQQEYDKIDAFTEGLLVYAYNQMIHHKMFPEFAALGFPAGEFLHEADDLEGKKQVQKDLASLRLRKTDFPHGIPVGLYIYPYLYLRSPHDNGADCQKMLKEIRNMSGGSFYAVGEFFKKWLADPNPDVRRYVARLFYLCDVKDIGFGPSEDKLIWARDCPVD
jgi:hypothetical protein